MLGSGYHYVGECGRRVGKTSLRMKKVSTVPIADASRRHAGKRRAGPALDFSLTGLFERRQPIREAVDIPVFEGESRGSSHPDPDHIVKETRFRVPIPVGCLFVAVG